MPQKRVLVVKGSSRRYPIKRVSKPVKQYVKKAVDRRFENYQSYQDAGPTASAYDSAFIEEINAGVSEGDKAEIKNIKINMLLTNPASAGTAVVRLIFFQWYNDNENSVPVIGDIFNTALSASYNVTRHLEENTFNNRVKGKLIKDMTVSLGEATSVEGNEIKTRKLLITQKMLGRKYIIGTNSTTNYKNAVYCLAISNVANASSPPTITMNSKVTYKKEA